MVKIQVGQRWMFTPLNCCHTIIEEFLFEGTEMVRVIRQDSDGSQRELELPKTNYLSDDKKTLDPDRVLMSG